MDLLKPALVFATLAFASISASGPASAQSDELVPQIFPDGGYADYDAPMINVPDERGCVKWCFRDDSPCDPPRYKRADNRCRSVD